MYNYYKLIELTHHNNLKIEKTFHFYSESFIKCYNILQEIAVKYYNALLIARFENKNKSTIILTSYGKSMLTLFSAHELTQKGLFGSSRILLRYILEYFMVAKYYAVSNNIEFYKKWDNGTPIFITQEIINKLKKPDGKFFKKIWKLLCSYTHATIYSQQIEIKYEGNSKEMMKEIYFNYHLLSVLLECNYHLLNSHFLNRRMKYYINRYGLSDEIKSLRSEFKSIIKIIKKNYSTELKSFLYNYKLKWHFK